MEEDTPLTRQTTDVFFAAKRALSPGTAQPAPSDVLNASATPSAVRPAAEPPAESTAAALPKPPPKRARGRPSAAQLRAEAAYATACAAIVLPADHPLPSTPTTMATVISTPPPQTAARKRAAGKAAATAIDVGEAMRVDGSELATPLAAAGASASMPPPLAASAPPPRMAFLDDDPDDDEQGVDELAGAGAGPTAGAAATAAADESGVQAPTLSLLSALDGDSAEFALLGGTGSSSGAGAPSAHARGERAGEQPQLAAASTADVGSGSGDAVQAERIGNVEAASASDMVADGEGGVDGAFMEYKPWKLPYGPKHEDHVVESATLATIEPPDVTYALHLPETAKTSGVLSRVQLEAVVYACQRTERVQPDGTRCGFFIGDGTGVGKGREVAALCWENWLCGRKRAVWLTASADLLLDANRDLRDIGASHIPTRLLSKIPHGQPIAHSLAEGVLVVPYSQLVIATRREQLFAWLGVDGTFDGLLALDEAHKAKAAQGGAVGQAVIELQQRYRDARVVYLSATGATQFEDMGYMMRLGLWGDYCAFPDVAAVSDVLKNSQGSMEMLAVSLKSEGAYIARSLGFRGVKLTPHVMAITDAELAAYNGLSAFWRDTFAAIDKYEAAHSSVANYGYGRATRSPKLVPTGRLTLAMSRSFEQLLLSIKARAIKATTRKALRAGKSVVICLFSTGETSTARAIGGDGGADALVSTAREVVANALLALRDRAGLTQPDLLAMIEDAENALARLPLPAGCLDELVNYFGPEHVAEMSGRAKRLIRQPPGTPGPAFKSLARVATGVAPAASAVSANVDSINVQERVAFQSGRKRIAIITDAGATGASLHADKRELNQQPRVHICAELGWSAPRVVQSFGRTHRTNQACQPEYVLLSTECAAEKRCAAAIATKLEALGALTKGDKRAATGEIGLFGISAGVRGLTPAEVRLLAERLDYLDRHGPHGLGDGNNVVEWWKRLCAAHPRIHFNRRFAEVSSIDDFLNIALLVPLEFQPSLVELLASYKGRAPASQAAMGLHKLASAAFTIEHTETLYDNAGIQIFGTVVSIDSSICFEQADALRRATITRSGPGTSLFCTEKTGDNIVLALFKDSSLPAGDERRPVRLVLPHNQCAERVIPYSELCRDYFGFDMDTPGSRHVAAVRGKWEAQLAESKAHNLHKETLQLMQGETFKMWPRVALILSGRLQNMLITTTDGRQVGGLLVPNTIPLVDVSYGLKMTERIWKMPSNLLWSKMPGSWWGPKFLLWLPRADARQLVEWARESDNAPVPARLAAVVGDGCVKAGDQLMGVMPSSNNNVGGHNHWSFNEAPAILKDRKVELEMPKASYHHGTDREGSIVFCAAKETTASSLELGQKQTLTHSFFALNTLFMPTATILTTSRRAGEASAKTVDQLLAQVSREEYVARIVAQLKEEDEVSRQSWTCRSPLCKYDNPARSNPRAEGARCLYKRFMFNEETGGYWPDKVQCDYVFSYKSLAEEEVMTEPSTMGGMIIFGRRLRQEHAPYVYNCARVAVVVRRFGARSPTECDASVCDRSLWQ